MQTKVIETKFPLIDADPHFSRVVRYFRAEDYGIWAAVTAAFPAVVAYSNKLDPVVKGPLWKHPHGRSSLKVCAILGFAGGFLMAYQNSSLRFWGWSENAREEARDLKELSELARQGKPLYGSSEQPDHILATAYRNSAFSQLKFSLFPMFNLVNHPYHGTDPAKYGVKAKEFEDDK